MGSSRKRSLTLPTSKINRLFRPFLSKISHLLALYPTSAPPSPSLRATLGPTSTKTYSRSVKTEPTPSVWTGTATGLPIFQPASPASRAKGAAKGVVQAAHHPGVPSGVDIDELSKRIHGVVEAFRNILEIAYPSQDEGTSFEPLGVVCARNVGGNIEGWIKDQLDEELGEEGPGVGDDVDQKREGRSVSLRDEWWESIPEHFRRYAIPVHALSILIYADIPLHSFYELILDACIKQSAVYEISLVLPHLILQAYMLPSTLHPPGPSYLPTLARKVPSVEHPLSDRWPQILSKSVVRLHRWLDEEERAVCLPFGSDYREVRWLGAPIDGLIRDGPKKNSSGAAFLVHLLDGFLEEVTLTSPPLSDKFAIRLSSWVQYQIWLSKKLSIQEDSASVVKEIDGSLTQLAALMRERLPPSTSKVLSGALLALNLHVLCLDNSTLKNEDRISVVSLFEDTIDSDTATFILSSHSTLSTVYTLSSCLRSLSLPNLEFTILRRAMNEYDRLSIFDTKSKLSAGDQTLQTTEWESLRDLTISAQARCAAQATATPGNPVNGIRWEELVGDWVEVTPNISKPSRMGTRKNPRARSLSVESDLSVDESSDDEDSSETYGSRAFSLKSRRRCRTTIRPDPLSPSSSSSESLSTCSISGSTRSERTTQQSDRAIYINPHSNLYDTHTNAPTNTPKSVTIQQRTLYTPYVPPSSPWLRSINRIPRSTICPPISPAPSRPPKRQTVASPSPARALSLKTARLVSPPRMSILKQTFTTRTETIPGSESCKQMITKLRKVIDEDEGSSDEMDLFMADSPVKPLSKSTNDNRKPNYSVHSTVRSRSSLPGPDKLRRDGAKKGSGNPFKEIRPRAVLDSFSDL
ncbi:hypothetical protein [Phaffia rhodozyma]|uniref:Uncharacterized protein n=1 Tax=Phaffia rhodozyma TaxID=264483 RepID=A0A0F7SF49_PHARH|nr:hypothetical protein [Phaffia rhodozyma]